MAEATPLEVAPKAPTSGSGPAVVAFVDEGLGNSSYLVDLGAGRALAVDPPRDPTRHLALAGQWGVTISHTADTHLHADFVTGSPELASRGAIALAPTEAGIERLAEDYLGDRSRLEAIGRRELAARLEAGDVVMLDVRPTPEFEAGHIPGARSMPIGELRQQLRALPKDADVVAYCRGPYCVYADDAVRLLRRRGYRARRLEDGFPEWKRAGLPVAAGYGG